MNKLAIKETFKAECKRLNAELMAVLETDDKETGVKVYKIQAELDKLGEKFIKAYYGK